MRLQNLLTVTVLLSLHLTVQAQNKDSQVIKCDTVITRSQSGGAKNDRLKQMIAKKLQERPESETVELKGFNEKFRISKAEIDQFEKEADIQVAHLVELALDASRPNALSEAAVESALKGIAESDPYAKTFIEDNALLRAKEAASLARQVRSLENKSLQQLEQESRAQDVAPEAQVLMSLDQLMAELAKSGGKVGAKVRIGSAITSLPVVGRFFQAPVDSTVTLADRVNGIITTLDQSMIMIQQNTNTLKDKRGQGERLLESLAREVTSLGIMLAKLQEAIEQVRPVDQRAASKLEGQARLRIAAYLEGKMALMVGINTGNEAMTTEIATNEMIITNVNLTKLTTVPITAQNLTVRANSTMNQMFMDRIDNLQNFTNQQMKSMGEEMKAAAVRAKQLSERSVLDPKTLIEVTNTVTEIKQFIDQGYIDAAKKKLADVQNMQGALQKSLNALASDGRQTPEDVRIQQITNDTNNVILDLDQAINQAEKQRR